MKLSVQYTGQLRTAVGKPRDEVELPEGSTLAELLQHLAGKLDEGASHLIAPDGRAQLSLLIVVNDCAVTRHEANTTTLHAGDVIVLMPPIAGG